MCENICVSNLPGGMPFCGVGGGKMEVLFLKLMSLFSLEMRGTEVPACLNTSSLGACSAEPQRVYSVISLC